MLYKRIANLFLCLFTTGFFLGCGVGNSSVFISQYGQPQGESRGSTEGEKTTGVVSPSINPIWIELPDTKLSDVMFDWSSQGGAPGVMKQKGVYAFSGAAFDTARNRLLIHGGGHGDYGGQEIYAFDIETFTWSMVATPDVLTAMEETECTLPSQDNYGRRTANNLPKSVHTYDRLVYVEQLDAMLDGRGSVGWSECRGNDNEAALYKFGTNEWEWWATPQEHPDDLPFPAPYALGGAGAAAAIHPTTKEIWFIPSHSGRLIRWNPSTNEWAHGGRGDNHMYATGNKVAIIDPVRNKLMISRTRGGDDNLAFYFVLLDEFEEDVTRVMDYWTVTTGDTDFLYGTEGRRVTFDYDPVGDQLVAWGGGSNIYTLNLDTLVWTQHEVPSAVPGAGSTAGTFGRFRYIDSIDKFLLTTSTQSNVFLLDMRAEQPVTTFELTSEITGTVPFTTAVGFKRGDVLTSPVLDLDNYQVDVKRRWPDNSVKHAIFSGTYNSVANSHTVVTVLSGGDTMTGVTLTEADIVTAAPTATVDLGPYGTASLSLLLGTPNKIWIQGPEMVEAHYHTVASGSSDLSVWFHVRLYKGGEVRVRTVVEYGYADMYQTADAIGYRPVVTIGGNTAYEFPLLNITDITHEESSVTAGSYRQVITTSAPHGWYPDDSFWVTGVSGMPELNNMAMRVSYSGDMTETTFRNYYDDSDTPDPPPTYTDGGQVLMAHHPHTRWSTLGWIGITDPETTVAHDTDYIQASELVPNYWKTGASESRLR